MADTKIAILVHDGWRFLATTTGDIPSYLEEMKSRIEDNSPKKLLTIRPFHTAISKVDPKTNMVTEWQYDKGYSLWERI